MQCFGTRCCHASSLSRTSTAACWASWAEQVSKVVFGHPLWDLQWTRRDIFLVLIRATVMDRAVSRDPPTSTGSEDFEPGWRWGWQHEAASRVERQHREDDILPTLDESARHWSSIVGHSFEPCTHIDSPLFRVLLLRRLRLPLPLVSRTCRCGRLLDSFGHHRAACS